MLKRKKIKARFYLSPDIVQAIHVSGSKPKQWVYDTIEREARALIDETQAKIMNAGNNVRLLKFYKEHDSDGDEKT